MIQMTLEGSKSTPSKGLETAEKQAAINTRIVLSNLKTIREMPKSKMRDYLMQQICGPVLWSVIEEHGGADRVFAKLLTHNRELHIQNLIRDVVLAIRCRKEIGEVFDSSELPSDFLRIKAILNQKLALAH